MASTPPPDPVPPPPPPGGPPGGVPPAPPSGPYGAPGAPSYGPAPVVSAPATGRNRIAGILALLGVVLIIVGSFLPIVEFDFGDLGEVPGVEDSASGWGDGLNDGPIHLIVAMAPLAAGIVILRNGAGRWAKILLIVAAVIGFFWVAIRFADISGSLEEEAGTGAFVEQLADPGIGLWAITIGWLVVLVAGLMFSSRPKSAPPPAQF